LEVIVAEVQLRLEVWRPARPDRRLLYEEPDDDGQSLNELQADHLHEQIYGWRLRGDVWTSLKTEESADTIRERLTTDFSPTRPPNERGFSKMRAILADMHSYLADEKNRQWQDWEQLTDEDDPDSTYRVQPLLSFLGHLRWLCDVFEDVPGASVTIR
jgi:hypothetical protein